MNSLNINLDHEILQLIAEVDEFKGAWKALGNLQPDTLNQLQKVATIESIGSSTRIEGSKLTDREVIALLVNLEIMNLDTRDTQEVAGFAELLNIIFANYMEIPLTESYIQQLHHILMKYSDKDQWHKGKYKTLNNHVVASDKSGKQVGVVFETASPFDTPMRMRDLVEGFNNEMGKNVIHPLLLIGIFVVEFLTIHPFQDGNGRLSRALTTYLLLRSGYVYVPYSSMEAVIEKQKSIYYISLRQTQATLNGPKKEWNYWLVFFLKVLKTQKDNLLKKIEREKIILTELPEVSQFIVVTLSARGKINISELEKISSVNRNTLKKHLDSLVKTNQIRINGKGKGTWYTLV